MIRRLTILLLIVGTTTLQAKNFGYYLIHNTKEDYSNSVLPGGYIGLGISIGKNNHNTFHWDTQITGAMHIISKDIDFTRGSSL